MDCPKEFTEKDGICVKEKLTSYPATKQFIVVDTVPVPHLYCITPKHLIPGRMYLDAEAIREAEKNHGAQCDICHHLYRKGKMPKVLSYDEHEQALLVAVDDSRPLKDVKELQPYLLSIKDKAVAEKYAGFAFIEKSKWHPK